MAGRLAWAFLALLPLLLLQVPLWGRVQNFYHGGNDYSIAHRAHIAEEAWRESVVRRQQWLNASAKTVRALFPSRKKNDGEPYVVWDFFPPTYSCPWDVQRVGHLGDGGKWLCGMSKYESIKSRPIVVYSFGIGNDSSFEAEMLDRTNTEIYAFDYTTDNFGPELSTKHGRAVFERIGLSGENNMRERVEYQTLTTIMKRLGHSYVDVVKMDIEGDEFSALNTLMDEFDESRELPIGQLLVELHHFENADHVMTVQEFADWWARFEGFGMRPVWCEANLITVLWETVYPCCAEYVWINTRDKNSVLWV